MQNYTGSILEIIENYAKKTLSEKRYLHSLGVAQTAETVLEHYKCSDCLRTFKGVDAGLFCGFAHDLGRELTDSQIIDYCVENKIPLTEEQIKAPVLAHGSVSAHIALTLVGEYPLSWQKAICVHTVGQAGMDDLALALFIADYIEPGRKFLSQEKRNLYLKKTSIKDCALSILKDSIAHWTEKKDHGVSESSLSMLKDLEGRV